MARSQKIPRHRTNHRALVLTVGLLRGGYVQREALPDIEGDTLEARILMPQGTPLSETKSVVARVTRALEQVDQPSAPHNQRHSSHSIHPDFYTATPQPRNRPHVATIAADCLGPNSATQRLMSSFPRGGAKSALCPARWRLRWPNPALAPKDAPLRYASCPTTSRSLKPLATAF